MGKSTVTMGMVSSRLVLLFLKSFWKSFALYIAIKAKVKIVSSMAAFAVLLISICGIVGGSEMVFCVRGHKSCCSPPMMSPSSE